MAAIQIHSDCQSTSTNIPNVFIDHYMPEANGEFVKVYIYLLRCLQNHSSDCTICAIADALEHTEKDITRALKYWDRTGLLRLEYGSDKKLAGICLCDFTKPDDEEEIEEKEAPVAPAPARTKKSAAPAATATVTAVAPAVEVVAPAVPARKEYTPDEVKMLSSDADVTELFFITETYLKHPLTATDINTILYWYDQLHFSSELIIYLVEYCISKGHSSMRYMDKVALGWSAEGIATIEQAKANASTHSKAYYAVMKALGISGRNLVDSEIAFVDKWSKEYAFDLDLIQEACARTIATIHQPSFDYTDSILTSWYKNKVHTKDDIQKLDAAHSKTRKTSTAATTAAAPRRTGFVNFDQRDYDYDALEAMLLTTSVE